MILSNINIGNINNIVIIHNRYSIYDSVRDPVMNSIIDLHRPSLWISVGESFSDLVVESIGGLE